MDLKDILTVAGKPGLYKLVASNKNGFIVESFRDNKRIPIFASDKISALDEISIFTENEDMPLKVVFVKLYQHLNHQAVEQSILDDNKLMKQLFEAFLPEYDEERVYASHQKKLFTWYNELLAFDLIDENIEEEPETEEAGKAEETDKTE